MELDAIAIKHQLNSDAAIQVTNGVFSPHIGKRFILSLFPDQDTENMDFILVEKDRLLTSGAQSNDKAYNKLQQETLETIAPCFNLERYEHIDVYIKKPDCPSRTNPDGQH